MPKPGHSVAQFFSSERSGEDLYEISHRIGKGSYGTVVAGRNRTTDEKVAIKHIDRVFADKADTVRIIRELRFLRLLKHPNIVAVKDVLIPQRQKAFDDIFIVTVSNALPCPCQCAGGRLTAGCVSQELLDTDLAHLIKSKTKYDDIHTRWLLFQLLRGLKHIHAANVFHRDLKPGNLLLNANCDLKICDFGLARANFTEEAADTPVFWTDYVATRWYRAPELICSYFTRYSAAVDMWAAGCIFGELMRRKAMFPGHNVYHQIDLITDFVGTPAAHTISKVRNHKARDYLSSLPRKQRHLSETAMPMLDENGVDLMSRMLAFDPDERISAEATLDHPYFAAFHNTLDESLIPPPPLMIQEEFAWENEKRYTVSDLRATLYGEICLYHPEMEGAPAPVGNTQRALGRSNSTYGENGTACADVKSQMQQLARGEKPTSRAATMPAPVTEALVAQAAATAAAARTPPRVRTSGEEKDAYSMYEAYSQDHDDLVDLPEEDLATERRVESLSADDIRKMADRAAEARAYNTRQVSPAPSPDVKKNRGAPDHSMSRSRSPHRSMSRSRSPPRQPPLAPPPPARSKPFISARVMQPPPVSASLREKVEQMRRVQSADTSTTEVDLGRHDEGCVVM
jgi:serine/threonine protein kinase